MGNRTRFQKLFEPGLIGKMEVKNRIAMAPMGTQMFVDGFVTEQLKGYFEARSRGGTGLITTDQLKISYPVGAGKKGTGRIDDDKFIPGLSELLQVVHRHGAKMVAQIGHMGPADIASGTHQPVAASPVGRQPDYTHPASSVVHYSVPRELTIEEIAATTVRFAEAAIRAKKAGFDAVQVHAANRYLLASFVSPFWNRRTDRYGGDLQNRARFVLEVVRAVREAVGSDYPVTCRINGEERDVQGGVTIALAAEMARMLEDAGVDAIDISSMFPHSPGYEPGFNVNASVAIKRAVSIPVIVAGRLGPELGENVLQQNKADFICIGRPLIADPELPNKAAAGRVDDIAPCVYCVNCLAVDRECTVNSARGKEREYEIKPAAKPKKVLVVGGGPGGMEAARVTALRGHQVTLYEREKRLGGQLLLASLLREEYEPLTRYLSAQMKRLGVRVELGQKVDATLISKLKPEVIVAATGAASALPDIPGIDRDNVVSGADIQEMMHGRPGKKGLKGQRFIWYLGLNLLRAPFGPSLTKRLLSLYTPFGKRVVVVGKGLAGIEMAHFLVEHGKKVTIVDTREDPPFSEPPMPVLREFMKEKLAEAKTITLTVSKIEQVTDKGLTVIDKEGKRQTIEGDTVVFASEYKPNTALSQALAGTPYEIHLVGDCAKPCGILEAIREGSKVGREI
ncbi:MAG: FAD-dependent oxidoreductase [Chloroflexi bacterium]|nr:FAD-dependent oxidoreductase [Chloroflexota bacterium]